MSKRDFEVTSFDGLKLKSRTWPVPSKVKVRARALFLHGFGEYTDLYDNWFPMVAEAGYEVTSYDQRGHGRTAKSPEEFGVSNEAGIMGDIDAMTEYVIEANRKSPAPLILWGFSMGAANCLNYMAVGKLRNKYDLYISVSPYLETAPQTQTGLNAIKIRLIPWVAWLRPLQATNLALTPDMFTNDPERWPLYAKQPYRHARCTAEFLNDAINRGHRLQTSEYLENMARKPLLLSQGEADPVCDPNGAKRFFKLAELSDKTLDLYPGLPHELMQCVEKDRQEHWHHVHAWLDKHTS